MTCRKIVLSSGEDLTSIEPNRNPFEGATSSLSPPSINAASAAPVLAADGPDFECVVDDGGAVVDVDPEHPASRAAAAIRTIDLLMALSRLAQVVGALLSVEG